MKRYVFKIILSAVLVLGIVGCGGGSDGDSSNLATTTPTNMNAIYATNDDSYYESILLIDGDDISIRTQNYKPEYGSKEVYIVRNVDSSFLSYRIKYNTENKIISFNYTALDSSDNIFIDYDSGDYIRTIYFQDEWYYFNNDGTPITYNEKALNLMLDGSELYQWINVVEVCENDYSVEYALCEARNGIREQFKDNPVLGLINSVVSFLIDSNNELEEALQRAQSEYQNIAEKINQNAANSDFTEYATPELTYDAPNEFLRYINGSGLEEDDDLKEENIHEVGDEEIIPVDDGSTDGSDPVPVVDDGSTGGTDLYPAWLVGQYVRDGGDYSHTFDLRSGGVGYHVYDVYNATSNYEFNRVILWKYDEVNNQVLVAEDSGLIEWENHIVYYFDVSSNAITLIGGADGGVHIKQ